jgi:hypothetical protein
LQTRNIEILRLKEQKSLFSILHIRACSSFPRLFYSLRFAVFADGNFSDFYSTPEPVNLVSASCSPVLNEHDKLLTFPTEPKVATQRLWCHNNRKETNTRRIQDAIKN